MGFVWLWVLVPLQRPVQWTMAAVIARVMIQWQESAAAVLSASLCSRTARPAKVKHHHSNCICHKLNLLLVVLQDTLGLFLHPELTGIAIELFMPPPPFVLALVPFCYLNFLFLDYIILFFTNNCIFCGATNLSLLSAFQLHILSAVLSCHQFYWQFFHYITVTLLSKCWQNILNSSSLNNAAGFFFYIISNKISFKLWGKTENYFRRKQTLQTVRD